MKFADAEPEEMSLVFDSWARSFQKSPWAGCIPNNIYPAVARAGFTEIVDRGASILVAYIDVPDAERRVMGYSVSEPHRSVLHWLFVKKDYRGLGTGRALLEETAKQFGDVPRYTYRTRASARFLGSRYIWCPELARIKG